MTDAAHLLSDFAGFMISLVALWLATRPATKTMSFGWYRSGWYQEEGGGGGGVGGRWAKKS